MSAYRTDFDETKFMSFLIKDEKFFGKYNGMWEKSAIASKNNLIVNLYRMKNI